MSKSDSDSAGPAASTLPIYQGLLDEVDADTRATVVENQGEGHRPPQDRNVDQPRHGGADGRTSGRATKAADQAAHEMKG